MYNKQHLTSTPNAKPQTSNQSSLSKIRTIDYKVFLASGVQFEFMFSGMTILMNQLLDWHQWTQLKYPYM